MKRGLPAFASVMGVAVLGTAFTGAPPAERDRQATGSGDYGTYCAPCHGVSGKGDGFLVARMATAPADLTLLRQRNGGVFPSGRVSHAIDGRRPAKAHGAMPAWGNAFREAADERGEAGVKKRIQGIVDYVESLQARQAGPIRPGGSWPRPGAWSRNGSVSVCVVAAGRGGALERSRRWRSSTP